MWWQGLVGILGGLLLVYAVLLLFLWLYARKHPETVTMKDVLRLLPDLLRLVRNLIADQNVPTRVRVELVLLLVYLLLPVDLVPDFLPVIGYADDIIIVALVLRSVMRNAGAPALELNWPGSPQGLQVIVRLADLGRR